MDKLKWLAVIVIFGLVLNVFLLYYLLFNLRSEFRSELSEKIVQTVEQSPELESSYIAELEKKASETGSTCSPSCLAEIEKVKEQIAKITPQIIKEVEKTNVTSSSNPLIQEYNIYLGSGTSKAWDWEDVPGAAVDIDSTKYTNIKSVRFEVALRIPTAQGLVYARLFNKSDKHPVWFSEVSSSSDTSTVKQSEEITLDSGNKTYQVQMKTTMGVHTILDSSRIKIVVE